MLEQLKNLTRDSIIYGVGHITTRLLTFLLLPYYSYTLLPAEYGELTLYFLFIGVAQAFYFYGLDIAYLRYFTLSKEPEARRGVTGTAVITALVSTTALSLLIILCAKPIGRLVVSNPTQPDLTSLMIVLCSGILFFDTLSTFPFLLLRGTLKPLHFTSVKMLNVAVNIGLNIWFVGSLDLSVLGVLWANLIASAVTLIVLLPVILRQTAFRFDRSLAREMIRFGLPNVPTYLFVMIIELADRKVLEIYRGLEESGLYSAGYKLGMFMAVVTGAFRFAWQPFFLSHAADKDAPKLFARVMTYYLLVTASLFIALSFFVEPLIHFRWPGIGYIIEPRYWAGLAVFPIILLAHVFDGVYANLMVGVYLKKLTSKLPLVTGVAAAFTVALNIVLIPEYGMMAAAWITLFAFVLEVILLWFAIRKYYHVPYEWIRIVKLFLATALIAGLGLFFRFDALWFRWILLLFFPVLLIVFGFFNERERFYLRKMILRK
ncbi:polysaccharide biosynthesis protein [candidate division KSB1 bacterium]|nr:MAG: polysaccharide biosynthesis protein [candidate division KSB1 bacterium]